MSNHVTRIKSKKREDLLKAAEELFAEKGLRPVTVEEIIRHAQVSKATFYKYFAGKESILHSMFQQLFDTVNDDLIALIQKAKQSRLTKEGFMSIFDVNRYDQFYKLDFIYVLMQDYPDVVEKLTQNKDRIIPLYHELIRMAKIDRIVRLDVDTDVLIIYTFLIKKAFRENPQLPEQMSMQEFVHKTRDLYLYGVMEKEEQD